MSDSFPVKGNILVIDDQFKNLQFLAELLMNEGYEVRPAFNATAAFKAIELMPPDLILLDIKMPQMDGYEVCQRLKADQRTCDIPVIFLSALHETEHKIKAFQLGGVDYITKPFQRLEVLARIETHLSLRRLQEQAKKAAAIQERHRLARDLHDSVVQTLFSSTLIVEAGHQLVQMHEIKEVGDYFERTGELIEQALIQMRLLLHQLRPPLLEEQGLIGALKQRLAMVENRTSLQVRLLAEEIELPAAVEVELYWIAQEALNNILKYAQADEVVVYLRREGGQITLEISDNGSGFDPNHLADGEGMGLSNMRMRAEKIGGTLKIESQKEKGTIITVSVEEVF